MLKDQNGTCKICKTNTSGTKRGNFAVDHCHKTGKIRGLLCSNCNVGLGYFDDSVELMEEAKQYLLDSKLK
jgi:hypothetical protein